MRHGKANGLCRTINKDTVEMFLMRESEILAWIQFNDKFEELARGGDQEILLQDYETDKLEKHFKVI